MDTKYEYISIKCKRHWFSKIGFFVECQIFEETVTRFCNAYSKKKTEKERKKWIYKKNDCFFSKFIYHRLLIGLTNICSANKKSLK